MPHVSGLLLNSEQPDLFDFDTSQFGALGLEFERVLVAGFSRAFHVARANVTNAIWITIKDSIRVGMNHFNSCSFEKQTKSSYASICRANC
jgi:hypothetical protein